MSERMERGGGTAATRIHPDQDPALVEEIIGFEKEVEDFLNTGFRTKPEEMLERYFEVGEHMRFFDTFTPLELHHSRMMEHWQKLGPKFTGKFTFEDYEVHGEGSVAFVTYIQRLVGKTDTGDPIDFAVRTTDGLRRTDRGWRVFHQHISFPVDLETFAVCLSAATDERRSE